MRRSTSPSSSPGLAQLAWYAVVLVLVAVLYVAVALYRTLPPSHQLQQHSPTPTMATAVALDSSAPPLLPQLVGAGSVADSELKRLREFEATLSDWEATLKAKQEAFERREGRVERDLAKRFAEVEAKFQTLSVERATWLQEQQRAARDAAAAAAAAATSTTTAASTSTRALSKLVTVAPAPARKPKASERALNDSSPAVRFLPGTGLHSDDLVHLQAPPPTQLSDYLRSLSTASAPRKSLNVLIVTFELAGGPRPAGGIGTAYQQLALALNGAGHRVTVLLASAFAFDHDSEWTPWVQRMAAKGIELEAAPFPELPLTNTGCGWSCIKSYCVYEWLKRQLPVEYDVVHFPENLGLAYFPLLAKRQGLVLGSSAIVIGLHGPHIWERQANQRWMDSLFDFQVVYQERKTAEWADWVVSPSAFLVDWLQRTQYWSLPGANRTLVHQNIITDVPSAPEGAQRVVVDRSRPTAADDIRELVFFGRLETRKGVALMMNAIDSLREHEPQAARQLHAVTLTFLGKDPQSASVQIGKRCAEWRGAPACQFELDRDRNSALQYLQGPGRVAVIPSLTENSPYTVMECAHLRVPLLASRVGGIPELLDRLSADLYTFRPEPRDLARVLAGVLLRGITASSLAHKPDAVIRDWVSFTERVAWMPRAPPPPAAAVTPPASSLALSVVVTWLAATESDVRALLKRVHEVARFAVENSYETIVVVSRDAMRDDANFLLRLGADPAFVAAKARIVEAAPSDAPLHVGRARNFGALECGAAGEFLLFVDVEDHFRGATSLSQLLHLARTERLDVATAQVLITENSIFNPDVDVSRVDTVSWVRSVELFVGCVDDAALGLLLNCYGASNALLRRSAFVGVGGFAANEFGVDSEFWSLFATMSLAGYRLAAHADVLFARTSRVELRAPGESLYAQLSRPLASATAALRHSSLRMAPLYTAHLQHALDDAKETHKTALAKVQTKYTARNGAAVPAAGSAAAASSVELETLRARLSDASAAKDALQHQLDDVKLQSEMDLLKVKRELEDAKRALRPTTTTPPPPPPRSAAAANDNDELAKENAELRRKLAKKCAAPAAGETVALLAAGVAKAPHVPGTVVVFDHDGREVRQRVLLLRGHEKSGTTWLRQLMSLHPQINMAPKEFQFNFVQAAVDKFTQEPWMGATPSLSHLAHQWSDEFVTSMLTAVAAKQPNKLWIGEKSPKSMEPVMPGAHYVYILRDGRDVLVSLFWHHVRIGGFKTWCDGAPPVAPADVEAWRRDNTYFDQNPLRLLALEKCVRITARLWKQVVETDLRLITRIRDDEKRLGDSGDNAAMVRNGHTRAIMVQYEALLDDTEAERRRLYEFLALDPREARALAAEDLTLPGVPKERSDAFFRKGVKGDWEQYFHADARRWFAEEAGDMLELLQYVGKGEAW
jgi:O-antigen biosynthesis protein